MAWFFRKVEAPVRPIPVEVSAEAKQALADSLAALEQAYRLQDRHDEANATLARFNDLASWDGTR